MAVKNLKMRRTVLAVSYKLFSEQEYKSVFLKNIASDAGINKSLLQQYFNKKGDIMNALLSELQQNSFQYVGEIVPCGSSDYDKIAMYSLIFWKAVSANQRLTTFTTNVIGEQELLDSWIDVVFNWERNEVFPFSTIPDPSRLRRVIGFSISGFMYLFRNIEKLGISVEEASVDLVSTFLKMMACTDEEIDMIIKRSRDVLNGLDITSFFDYCKEKIDWFVL